MIKSKIFLKIILVISSMIIIYTSALFFIAIPKIDNTIQNIEQKSAKEVLYKVITITKNFDKDLKNFKELSIEQHKSELKNLTNTIWSIIQIKYNQSKSKEQYNEVINLINKISYDSKNYYFLSDYNSVLISHPYLQGKDMSTNLDIKGNLIMPPMVDIARTKSEGFYSYWWKKNKNDNKPYEKLAFIKDFPGWNMVIGTGVYIDGIEKEIEKRKKELFKQLTRIIKTTTIGKTGYLYIFNGKGKMLIHPNGNINGKDAAKLINPTKGTYLFDDLKNASKTKSKSLYYKWDKPSDKGNYIYNKVSVVEYIPELDWYIGSSVYLDQIKDSSYEIKQFIIILSILLLIILSIYSFIFFRNLLNPVVNLSKIATKVSQGDFSVRSNLRRDDEVGVLSDSFNNMVQRVEKSISEEASKNIKLQESINSFQVLLNTTIEAIFIFEDDYCVDTNESTYKLFGYETKEDMFGMHALDFISPKSKELVLEMMKQDNTLPYEANCIKLDGTIFPALIKGKNIEINNKHVRIAVLVDLTELKQKDKQIIEQIRLAQLGEMISMIAHQWRQPLNVLGALNMKVETKLDFEDFITAEGYKPISDDITRQLSFMSKTIDDFRDFFKPNKEKQDTSFSELVNCSLSIIKSSILNKNIELILELNSDDRFVVYKNEVTQVLLNILKNSQDILIQRKIKDPYIKISSISKELNNNSYVLTISDNAGGIAADVIDKIFDPYFSTKSEKHGSGLGLYMSKTIIEEHCHGKLSVTNDKDGAKFIIELPVLN